MKMKSLMDVMTVKYGKLEDGMEYASIIVVDQSQKLDGQGRHGFASTKLPIRNPNHQTKTDLELAKKIGRIREDSKELLAPMTIEIDHVMTGNSPQMVVVGVETKSK